MFTLNQQIVSVCISVISVAISLAIYRHKQLKTVSVEPLYFDQYEPCSHVKFRLRSENSVYIKSVAIENKWVNPIPKQASSAYIYNVGATVSPATPIEIDLFVYPRLTESEVLSLRIYANCLVFSRTVLTPKTFVHSEKWPEPISRCPRRSWSVFDRQCELIEALNKDL